MPVVSTFSFDLLLPLLAIGAIGGFLSGLLGVGGGIIFVPALYFFLSARGVGDSAAMHISIGTSLALVFITGASSAFWHHKKGAIDFFIVKSWAPFAVLGVAAGTFFASSIEGGLLRQIFAGAVLLIAIYMAVSKEPETEPAAHRLSGKIQKLAVTGIGALSALIGIGGAMMTIPFMAYNGVPMRKTVGTGAALGCVIALPAVAGYILSGLRQGEGLPGYSLGYVNILAAAVISASALLLSPLGVHVSHLLPKKLLRRIFAVVLAAVALQMLAG